MVQNGRQLSKIKRRIEQRTALTITKKSIAKKQQKKKKKWGYYTLAIRNVQKETGGWWRIIVKNGNDVNIQRWPPTPGESRAQKKKSRVRDGRRYARADFCLFFCSPSNSTCDPFFSVFVRYLWLVRLKLFLILITHRIRSCFRPPPSIFAGVVAGQEARKVAPAILPGPLSSSSPPSMSVGTKFVTLSWTNFSIEHISELTVWQASIWSIWKRKSN